MIADRDVKMKLKDVLDSIINNNKKLQQMNEACHALGKPNAGREIARRILELAT
jgi:UDP-N-acetylglucosamine:LPS N-acetylglucosamine transferase